MRSVASGHDTAIFDGEDGGEVIGGASRRELSREGKGVVAEDRGFFESS